MTESLPKLLTEQDLCERYGKKLKTIQNWRTKGYGPDFIKAGGSVYYKPEAVDRWEREQERNNRPAVIR